MRSGLLILSLLVSLGAARPREALPMPNAINEPFWSCADNKQFTRGQWGINIVPWWGYPPNIYTTDPYFKAFVITYSQNEFVNHMCDSYAHPVACGLPDDVYNFTAKDAGIEGTIHVKMGGACQDAKRPGFDSPEGRQDFMDLHWGNFKDAAISVGEEGIWIDLDMEVKRSKGEAAGNGICHMWDVPHGNLRTGAVCALPLDFKDGKIW